MNAESARYTTAYNLHKRNPDEIEDVLQDVLTASRLGEGYTELDRAISSDTMNWLRAGGYKIEIYQDEQSTRIKISWV